MAQVTSENDRKQWAIKVSELEKEDGVQDVTTDLSNKVFYESMAYAFQIPIMMFLMLCLNINTSIFICHYIWTVYFGCVTPLPFLYTITFVFVFPGALAIFWFSFPSALCRDVKTRKRIRRLIVWILSFAMACYERLTIVFLFLNTPQNIQPIWALVLPVWREARRALGSRRISTKVLFSPFVLIHDTCRL